jgi:coenzyme F420-reducing hydrogenase beta subunit
MLNRIIDKLTKKTWSEAELDAMLGVSRAAYLTHAADDSIREQAASGGTSSALLVAALESGRIDGAIVCRTFVEEGKVRAHFVLARTREEILTARGSKYVETRFLREVLPILEENEGRFAVCGLPCDITNLTRWEEKNQRLAGKVALKIAFLCGHNSRKELIDGVTCKLCKQAGGQIVDYNFRTGHWRGQLSAKFDNGRVIRKPFSYFSDYRNLYFFAERKCVACIDHFGYDSDISMGDVWLYALRDAPIKHTGVLVRSERAARLLDAAVAEGCIVAEEVPREMILDGQTRIAPTHFNVSARSRAGKWLGVKIPDRHNMKVGPIKWFSAFVGLANMRWSESGRANLIFKIPRPVLRGYLVFKKGIESIK